MAASKPDAWSGKAGSPACAESGPQNGAGIGIETTRLVDGEDWDPSKIWVLQGPLIGARNRPIQADAKEGIHDHEWVGEIALQSLLSEPNFAAQLLKNLALMGKQAGAGLWLAQKPDYWLNTWMAPKLASQGDAIGAIVSRSSQNQALPRIWSGIELG